MYINIYICIYIYVYIYVYIYIDAHNQPYRWDLLDQVALNLRIVWSYNSEFPMMGYNGILCLI